MSTLYIHYPIMNGGIPSFPLLAPDGTVSAPSYSFASEPNTGFYHPSGGTIGVSILGTEVLQFNSSTIQGIVPFAASDGNAAAPSFTFATALTTGLYKFAANSLGFTSNGVSGGHIDASQNWTFIGQVLSKDGTAASPGFAWANEPNTGSFRPSGGTIGFSILGSEVLQLNPGSIEAIQPLLPDSGILGLTSGTNAAAGIVGEFVSSFASTTSAGSTGQYKDLTSISLTAGDWDVCISGEGVLNTSTTTEMAVGISITPGNSSTGLASGDNFNDIGLPISTDNTGFSIPLVRQNLTTTTTVYFKIYAVYSLGTPQFRGRISARRVR